MESLATKGEVDHVSGVAKVAVRTEIAAGEVFERSNQIVSFLRSKFQENEIPKYHMEIEETFLNEERDEDHRKVFKTIEGSSDFHVIIFTPHSNKFKASPRLCLCNQCHSVYGSCDLFTLYEIRVQELNSTSLRSNIPPPPEIVGEEEVSDFVTPGTIVAAAAPKFSTDTVWLIKVVEVNWVLVTETSKNDYDHEIAPGIMHLSGHFLECNDRLSTLKATIYNLSDKTTYLFKESILYPFLNIHEKDNKGISLSMQDYTDILYYIEKNGCSHL